MAPLALSDLFVSIARKIGLERLAAIHTRRSYSRKPLEKEELEKRINAMRFKPSAEDISIRSQQ